MNNYEIDIFLGHIEIQHQYRELPNGSLTCFSRSIKVHRDGKREYGEWWQTGGEIIGSWQQAAADCGIAVERQPLLNRMMNWLGVGK